MTGVIGEEYGRWARNRIAKKYAQKPRIKVVGRLRGKLWWQCRGGMNYDGHGWTPADAYRMWQQDLIPF